MPHTKATLHATSTILAGAISTPAATTAIVMAADCSRSCQASRPLTDKFSHQTSVGSGALQHEQRLCRCMPARHGLKPDCAPDCAESQGSNRRGSSVEPCCHTSPVKTCKTFVYFKYNLKMIFLSRDLCTVSVSSIEKSSQCGVRCAHPCAVRLRLKTHHS